MNSPNPLEPANEAATGKPRVQSVARAIDLLQAIAPEAGGIAAKDLALKLALPRQVVYHLLRTLADTGMVRKQTASRYVLGPGVAPLAESFNRQLQAPDPVGDYVQQAARLTGETAYVSGWVDNNIVVRATAAGRNAIHVGEVNIGTRHSPHCRASGKLLLAMLPPAEADRYIASSAFVKMTGTRKISAARLRSDLEKIRETWVGVEYEEFAEGVACMAVPVGPAPSRLVLALSAPVERLIARQAEYLEQLREVAMRNTSLRE